MREVKSKWQEGKLEQIPETPLEAFVQDIKNPKISVFSVLKQYFYCSLIHRYWKCYPRVDVADPCEIWHCDYCHSCSEGLYAAMGDQEKEKEAAIEHRKHSDDLIKRGLIRQWWQSPKKELDKK